MYRIGNLRDFQRFMQLLAGRCSQVLNLSDFAIDARYRTLGPALGLLRATLAAVAEGGFAFSYDVPSGARLALYKRRGYVEFGRMERRVRPLPLVPALERRRGAAARLLGLPFGIESGRRYLRRRPERAATDLLCNFPGGLAQGPRAVRQGQRTFMLKFRL